MGRTPTGRARRRRGPGGDAKNDAFRRERERRKWTREDVAEWASELAGRWGYQGIFTGEQVRRIETDDVVPEEWRRQVFCALFALLPEQLGFPVLPAILRRSGHSTLTAEEERTNSRSMPDDAIDEERLAFILAHPQAVDQRSLDDVASLTRMYASRAQSIAPAVLVTAVFSLIGQLRSLLAGSHPDTVRRRLQALYAESVTIAGRLAFWSDDRGQAEHLFKLAGRLADEIGERHLQAVVLAFRADLYSTVPYIGTIPNNTNLALTLFEEASRLDGADTPPLLRSWVCGCRAEEYATLKRGLESDRDMERAHAALAASRPGAGDQVLDIAVLDIAAAAAGLSGFEGACAIALGRAREAREAFEAGLKEQSSVGRLSGLAAAFALEGDIEQSVELLTRGLDEAIRRQLPTRRRRVEGVRAAFLSHASDHPAVKGFDERLRAAIG